MQLTTVVRDCLYLNWAVPVRALPEPPPPLQYDVASGPGGDVAFVSALLFRQHGLQLAAAPIVRASYPQFNLRFNTHSVAGPPSVLFQSMLVPFWITPAVRWAGRQPARAASFRYPRDVSQTPGAHWTWTVGQSGCRLVVRAEPSPPMTGSGPVVGNWEQTVSFFRQRPIGYTQVRGKLHAIQTTHPRVTVWPVRVEIRSHELLERLLPLDGCGGWPQLHSAWLCPEIPFSFELMRARTPVVVRQAAATG